MKQFFIAFLLVVSLLACKGESPQEDGPEQGRAPVARAYDAYLYADDLDGIVGPGTAPEDSAMLVGQYVDEWARQQVVLHAAKLDARYDPETIERRVEEYRNTLIAHEYAERHVRLNLDRSIGDSLVEAYYEENKGRFKLDGPIVKALFLKIDKEIADERMIRRLVRSRREQDLIDFKLYCETYAQRYVASDTTWEDFDRLIRGTPFMETIKKPAAELQYKRHFEAEEGDYLYYLKIVDQRQPGQQAPLRYVRDKIAKLLLNRRRVELQAAHALRLYQQAESINAVEVFGEEGSVQE